jgi:uncharacterized membrane protein YkoI
MTAKYHLTITIFVAFALLGYGTISGARAGDEGKAAPYHASIQVLTSEQDEAKPLAAAKINPDDAKAAAMEKYKGSPFKYVKIHNVKGNLVYEVEFQDGKEYILDAGNKKLLTISQEGKVVPRPAQQEICSALPSAPVRSDPGIHVCQRLLLPYTGGRRLF